MTAQLNFVSRIWRGGWFRVLREFREFRENLGIMVARRKQIVRSAQLFPYLEQRETAGWVYHSEKWARVVRRWEHRAILQQGRCLSVIDDCEAPGDCVTILPDGSLRVRAVADAADKWVYLYLRPEENLWRDFSWKFYVRRDSNFRELQFGFRYQDFYNRYRFRHENDFMHFDKVVNGRFINGLRRRPFKMELGREYCFEIKIIGYYASLTVDDARLMEAYDPERSFLQGSIAVILWENDGVTPISAEIRNPSVVELLRQNQSLQ